MKILVIGSGPIVIGQAAEFDYSGTQACEALRESGHEVVLINSNPATIMTDREVADKIYIEPMTLDFVKKIIDREMPEAIIPSMGGQTALNLALELEEDGFLKEKGIKLLGTDIEGIKKGEDREKFRNLMTELGEPVTESKTVNNLEEGLEYAEVIGYPVVLRPAYTLGGTGGGTCYNEAELKETLSMGLKLSQVHQVLVEKSIAGWKEIEYEVVRDKEGNKQVICTMENMDPVGVHTGDSIVIAPSQTLSTEEVTMLRESSFRIIDAVGIIGGCNVQFALNPDSLDYAVIEINPRLSRSSALASKATGYPIARVATKLALGMTLNEVPDRLDEEISVNYEPMLDYVAIKFPKWPFDKFFTASRQLGTKMMATGEVMAIGVTLEQAILKGLRSLEIDAYSLYHEKIEQMSLKELKEEVLMPKDERIFYMAALLRAGYDVNGLHHLTGVDTYFLNVLKNIVDTEEILRHFTSREDLTKERLEELKRRGFSDVAIAEFVDTEESYIRELRALYNIYPNYRCVSTGPTQASSPYYYSTYEGVNESKPSNRKKVVVLGSGPIRIGQGIEFDYCNVHAITTLKEMGIETIMINNNPETLSTDFDISDKLYFEPLTEEDTLNILELEKPDGVILQFGGQTALKLAKAIEATGITVYGTSPSNIDRAEDRGKFDKVMEKLELRRPQGRGIYSIEEGLEFVEELGYPVLVRPSYVIGGQGMEVCWDEKELIFYLTEAFSKDKENPVLIDEYIGGMECEVDGIYDGEDLFIPGIMEHLEPSGIHSGDSISIYPSTRIPKKLEETILEETKKMAEELDVRGMINIQYIIRDGELFIIEVNPRSSRTVPYLSKVTGVNMIALATRVSLGEKLADLGYGTAIGDRDHLSCIKVPVFSTEKLTRVEASLGPEMRSTGEVLGVGKTTREALAKGLLAAGMDLSKRQRSVLVTLRDGDKKKYLPLIKDLQNLGYKLYGTQGTMEYFQEQAINMESLRKADEPSPNCVDYIRHGDIDIVLNTPTKGNESVRDGFIIRRATIESKAELFTNYEKAVAYVDMLMSDELEHASIYELSEY